MIAETEVAEDGEAGPGQSVLKESLGTAGVPGMDVLEDASTREGGDGISKQIRGRGVRIEDPPLFIDQHGGLGALFRKSAKRYLALAGRLKGRGIRLVFFVS